MITLKNITVIGAGYVGFSYAYLLSKHYNVTLYDINDTKVKAINSGNCPIDDTTIGNCFDNQRHCLKATSNKVEAYENNNLVLICAPTD